MMEEEIIGKKYLILKELDCGATSRVYLVRSIENEEIYAAKVYMNHSHYYLNEIEILKMLNLQENPGIVRLIEYGEEPIIRNGIAEEENYQYIILNYLPNKDLFYYIKDLNGFNERTAKFFFYKIVKAVEHCHNYGICHEDIKLENILLDENNYPVLCDFGYSRIMKKDNDSNILTDFLGTEKYASPEKLKGVSSDGTKNDIFSLGVILFCMIFVIFGFPSATRHSKLYKLIIRKKYSEYWKELEKKLGKEKIDNISPEFKRLYLKMVAYKPNERPSIEEILDDDWFKNL